MNLYSVTWREGKLYSEIGFFNELVKNLFITLVEFDFHDLIRWKFF